MREAAAGRSVPRRGPRLRLRPAVLALAIGAAVYSHGRVRGLRESRGRGERAALAGVLSPAEAAAASILGGFRSIAINIAWLRLYGRLEEQRHDGLPALYSALELLQGGSPMLYRILAGQMVFDIPRRLPHRPDERWEWIQEGLAALERGRRRFPDRMDLHREAGYVYYLRFHAARSPADRERFLSIDAARGGRPAEGSPRDPLLIALEAAERALGFPEHQSDVDRLLWAIYREAYAASSRDPRYLKRARELLDHAREAHPRDQGLELLGRQIEEEERGR